jgi:hypothetical protein
MSVINAEMILMVVDSVNACECMNESNGCW